MELPTAQIQHTQWNSEVYEPSDDSFLLVDALKEHAAKCKWSERPPALAMEIGCGSGFVVCSLALMLQKLAAKTQVFATDHSLHAVAATQQTLANHDVSTVDVIVTDLVKGFGPGLMGHVDVLLFNPPYVPTPDEELKMGGVATAWAGGYMGRRVIDRLLPQLVDILSEEGEFFMVAVSENDPLGIIEAMKAKGFVGSVLMSRQADEESLCIVHLKRVKQSPEALYF